MYYKISSISSRIQLLRTKMYKVNDNDISLKIVRTMCTPIGIKIISNISNSIINDHQSSKILINHLSVLRELSNLLEEMLLIAIYNEDIDGALDISIVMTVVDPEMLNSIRQNLNKIDFLLKKYNLGEKDRLKKRKIIYNLEKG